MNIEAIRNWGKHSAERARSLVAQAPTYAQHLRDFLGRNKEAIFGVLITQVGLAIDMTLLANDVLYKTAYAIGLSVGVTGVLFMIDGSFRTTAGHGQGIFSYLISHLISPRPRQ